MEKASLGKMRAGAAMVDITPRAGTRLSGSGCGEHRPARSVLDPLYAKAIVFETDSARLCVVTMDVTIITAEYSRGGHEANREVTCWAKLAPGSLETVAQRAVVAVRGLFA